MSAALVRLTLRLERYDHAGPIDERRVLAMAKDSIEETWVDWDGDYEYINVTAVAAEILEERE